jgi:hypothetical protein
LFPEFIVKKIKDLLEPNFSLQETKAGVAAIPEEKSTCSAWQIMGEKLQKRIVCKAVAFARPILCFKSFNLFCLSKQYKMAETPNQSPTEGTEDPKEISMVHDETPAPTDSVLLDMADMSGYDKNLRNARIWLYVISGMQIVLGIYESLTLTDAESSVQWVVFGVSAGLGLLFLACALWSYKKPYTAFLTALILYIIITVGAFVIEPANISFGIIIKTIVVVALFRAVKDAREIEDIKNSFNIYS